MKVLKSIALLFFLCWVGDIVSAYLPFPIPGSIISMALLFILLLPASSSSIMCSLPEIICWKIWAFCSCPALWP